MAAEALTASLCQAGDRRNSESKELNQEEARKHQESKWGEQQLWRSVLVPSASQIHDRLSFTLLSEERWRQLCLKESLLTYQTTYLETFNPILCPAKGVPCSSVIRIAIKQKLLGVFLKSTDVRTMERCNYKRETQIWFTFLFLTLTLAEEISENQTRSKDWRVRTCALFETWNCCFSMPGYRLGRPGSSFLSTWQRCHLNSPQSLNHSIWTYPRWFSEKTQQLQGTAHLLSPRHCGTYYSKSHW